MLAWFEDNNIVSFFRIIGRLLSAVFQQQPWAVYDLVLKDQDRANNHAEAAPHRRLETEFDVKQPSIAKEKY